MTQSTSRLAAGRLEVETDLLLGVDDVLLPRGVTRSAPQDAPAPPTAHGRSAPTPSLGRGGFDAALFESRPGGASSPSLVEAKPCKVEPRKVETSNLAAEPRTVPSASPRPVGAAIPVEAPRDGSVEARVPVPLKDLVRVPELPSKQARLAWLEEEHARNCPHCTTATAHTRLVFGEGSPDAELMFVGEAPGETEDQMGRPFVGRAGEKLDEMIGAMGLRREDAYIANVLKSRPPDNRTPLAHEVEKCGPYLLAQLSIIRPKAIVTLGGPATKLLLATEQGITRLRGIQGAVRIGEVSGDAVDLPVMPTFHPAYLLRNYTPETRRQVWEDLKKALALIGREAPKRGAS